jgi:hypothetical protein
MKIPTGVQLPEIYVNVAGEIKSRLKDEGDFGSFFQFSSLTVENHNSNFLVDLSHPHSIASFSGVGEYLTCAFN